MSERAYDVDKVVRDKGAFGGGRFRRADVHTGIEQCRIEADDFDRKGFGNFEGERGFAAGGLPSRVKAFGVGIMFQVWKMRIIAESAPPLYFAAEARRRQGAGLPYAFINAFKPMRRAFNMPAPDAALSAGIGGSVRFRERPSRVYLKVRRCGVFRRQGFRRHLRRVR